MTTTNDGVWFGLENGPLNQWTWNDLSELGENDVSLKYHIGVNRKKINKKKTKFNNWRLNHPNQTDTVCGLMDADELYFGEWMSVYCGNKYHGYVCQKESSLFDLKIFYVKIKKKFF